MTVGNCQNAKILRFFPQSDTCFKCCNCFLQDHIRTRYSLNKTYRMSCHLWTGPPPKPAFPFLLCFCLCVAKLKVVFFFFAFLPPKTSGISIKERRESGQMDGVERDASPQTSNLPSGMCKSRLRIMLNSAALTDLYSVSLCSEGSRGREYVNLLQQFIMGIGLI